MVTQLAVKAFGRWAFTVLVKKKNKKNSSSNAWIPFINKFFIENINNIPEWKIHSIFSQRLQCYYHNVTIKCPFEGLQLMSKAAKCGATAVAKVLDVAFAHSYSCKHVKWSFCKSKSAPILKCSILKSDRLIFTTFLHRLGVNMVWFYCTVPVYIDVTGNLILFYALCESGKMIIYYISILFQKNLHNRGSMYDTYTYLIF